MSTRLPRLLKSWHGASMDRRKGRQGVEISASVHEAGSRKWHAIHRATIGKRLKIMPLSRWNQRFLDNGAGIASPVIGSARARDSGDAAMIRAPFRCQSA